MTRGRPSLNVKPTVVRFRQVTLDEIDALVGKQRRANFIREAVETALKNPAGTKDESGGD